MPLEYNPKDAVVTFPEGDYEATLIKVEDKTSKQGNQMQVWTFRAYAPDGRDTLVTEYVVVPGATFKVKQLAKSLGQEQQFVAGQFQADDHVGASLVLELYVESQEGFDDKNRIRRFKPVAGAAGSAAARAPSRRPAERPVPVGAGANGHGESTFDQPSRLPAAKGGEGQPPFGDEKHFKEDDIPF